jgi:CDP-glucose 4,6-dehydratase
MIDLSYFSGKRIFLSGHTGFKGSWMTCVLSLAGAKVYGYALPPTTTPSLFDLSGIARDLVEDVRGDVRSAKQLLMAVQIAEPDVMIHMAAQPLVNEGYIDPVGTFETNTMGTVHFMESARSVTRSIPIVIVSSDKCYRNDETGLRFKEDDPLGGQDPYSASKAATEIAAISYTESFFLNQNTPNVATARAGNVVGGGDWSVARLFPDLVRAFSTGQPAILRNPDFTRPWQHVLEPVAGYLRLAEKLGTANGVNFIGGWNFGPTHHHDRSVKEVATIAQKYWGEKASLSASSQNQLGKEAAKLSLDSTKAEKKLGWSQQLDFEATIKWSIDWYRAVHAKPECARQTTIRQIERYFAG